MREIKFRAWNGEQMHFASLGDFIANIGFEDAEQNVSTFSNGNPLSPKTPIMQYTGLKDKNGVEIYEGDIVKIPADVYIGTEIVAQKGEFHDDAFIEWVDGSFRLNKLNDDSKHYYGVLNFSRNTQSELLEVIGNIYENKELLK